MRTNRTFLEQMIKYFSERILLILVICFAGFCASLIIYKIPDDDTSKVRHGFTFSYNGEARDNFYKAYEKRFLLEDQLTITMGLEYWVNNKLKEKGFKEYKDFYYLNGKKYYFDELPIDL